MTAYATADDIDSLNARITPIEAMVDAFNANGLYSLLMQRAYTFANQLVRIDQYGMEIQIPTKDSGKTQYSLWGIQKPNYGGDPSLQFPHFDLGLTYDSTYGLQAFWEARSAVDYYAQIQAKAQDGSSDNSALLQSVISNVEVARVEAVGKAATATGYVEVNPVLKLVYQVDDTKLTTPGINGVISFRNDLSKYRGVIGGSVVNFVTSDATADDLSQYALLAGRAGGQSLALGTQTSGAQRLDILESTDTATVALVKNSNASGTTARGAVQTQADTAAMVMMSHGTGRTVSRFGVTIGGYNEIDGFAGNGLLIGTTNNTQFRLGTNATLACIIGTDQVLNVCANVATPAGGSTSARLIFGTTSGFGIYYGSGAPTVSAGQGSLYIRADGSSTSTRLYSNTNGSTGWTNFTSAA